MRVGFVLFPRLTQLDLTGPCEVLSRVPGVEAVLVAATREPVAGDSGLRLVPDVTFAGARGDAERRERVERRPGVTRCVPPRGG
jgi:cyclohexyl-isocyanide hydratase